MEAAAGRARRRRAAEGAEAKTRGRAEKRERGREGETIHEVGPEEGLRNCNAETEDEGTAGGA